MQDGVKVGDFILFLFKKRGVQKGGSTFCLHPDHVKDSSRERLLGLKFTLNERLETIQKLDETILENTKGRDIEKEVEDSGAFCANVYRILARIDLSLEDAKNSIHVGTSPSFIQGTCNNNVKSKEGANLN